MICRKVLVGAVLIGVVSTVWAGAGSAAEDRMIGVAPKVAATTAPGQVEQYGGYFVKNTFEPEKGRSVVVVSTQAEFDKVFGSGFVMNDKSHRLAAGVFEKQLVLAAISRGHEPVTYTVQESVVKDGTLTLRYQAQTGAGDQGASFASPLIVSVGREGVTSVRFVENEVEVGVVKVP